MPSDIFALIKDKVKAKKIADTAFLSEEQLGKVSYSGNSRPAVKAKVKVSVVPRCAPGMVLIPSPPRPTAHRRSASRPRLGELLSFCSILRSMLTCLRLAAPPSPRQSDRQRRSNIIARTRSPATRPASPRTTNSTRMGRKFRRRGRPRPRRRRHRRRAREQDFATRR